MGAGRGGRKGFSLTVTKEIKRATAGGYEHESAPCVLYVYSYKTHSVIKA